MTNPRFGNHGDTFGVSAGFCNLPFRGRDLHTDTGTFIDTAGACKQIQVHRDTE